MCLSPRIRHFNQRLPVRIRRLMLGPIVECHPIDVVDEGFRGGVFGEDQ